MYNLARRSTAHGALDERTREPAGDPVPLYLLPVKLFLYFPLYVGVSRLKELALGFEPAWRDPLLPRLPQTRRCAMCSPGHLVTSALPTSSKLKCKSACYRLTFLSVGLNRGGPALPSYLPLPAEALGRTKVLLLHLGPSDYALYIHRSTATNEQKNSIDHLARHL